MPPLSTRLRSRLASGTAFQLLAVLFVVAAAVWFVLVAANNGNVDAGQAFVGLGYITTVVLVILAVLMVVRHVAGVTPGNRPDRGDADYWNHRLISSQLWIGALLILAGATLGLVFGVILDDTGKLPLAIGTAVIGAGAALMPPGVAAGASQRLQDSAANGSAGKDDGKADGDAPTLRAVVPQRGSPNDEVRVLGSNLLIPADHGSYQEVFVSFDKHLAKVVGLRKQDGLLAPDDADAGHLPQHKASGEDRVWVQVPEGIGPGTVKVTVSNHAGVVAPGAIDFEIVDEDSEPNPQEAPKKHRKGKQQKKNGKN